MIVENRSKLGRPAEKWNGRSKNGSEEDIRDPFEGRRVAVHRQDCGHGALQEMSARGRSFLLTVEERQLVHRSENSGQREQRKE